MRKTAFVLLCALGALTAPRAEATEGRWHLGVHGGLNVSKFDRYASVVQTRRGLAVGAYLEQDITSRFGVRGEVLYTEKGGFFGEEWWERTRVTTYVRCDDLGCHLEVTEVDQPVAYVEFPILLSVQLLRTPWLGAHLLLGPALGVRVREDVRFVGDRPPRLDGSMVTVLGTGVSVGPGELRIEARYTHGLRVIGRYLGRNVASSLLVGYAYGL